MEKFNVLIHEFNSRKVEYYDVIPFFVREYKDTRKSERPQTFEEFRDWVRRKAQWQYWARCEYEFLIVPWPYKESEPLADAVKIDVYYQLMGNLDILTELVMKSI